MTKTEPSLLAQADHYIDGTTGAIVPPVHASTTYSRDEHYVLIGAYGVESLVEHRATIEGPNSVVPPDLVRMSVGIEDPDELIADLEQALDSAS